MLFQSFLHLKDRMQIYSLLRTFLQHSNTLHQTFEKNITRTQTLVRRYSFDEGCKDPLRYWNISTEGQVM